MKKYIVSIGLSVVLSVIITGMILTPGCAVQTQDTQRHPSFKAERLNHATISIYLIEFEGHRYLANYNGGIIQIADKQ